VTDSNLNSPTERPSLGASTTAGGMLSSCRRAAGISIEEVSDKLKLSKRQIEALEADRYTELPGNTFVRGFVRNYARFLAIDPQPLLGYLDRTLPVETPQSALPRLGDDFVPLMRSRGLSGSRLLLLLVLAVLIAAVAAGAYWWRSRSQLEPKLLVDETSAETVADPVVATELPLTLSPPPSSLPSLDVPPQATSAALLAEVKPPLVAAPLAELTVLGKSITAPPLAEKLVSEKLVTDKPVPAPATQSSSPPPPTLSEPANSGELLLVARQDSWMTVVDGGGKKLLSSLVKAGETKALTGTPPYTLRVGNASNVEVIFKGKPADLKPYTKVDVATLVLQ
jgi:cytoskeleton protein RodZ